jgi:glycosyltransferase involved in cell wall biosynthesis
MTKILQVHNEYLLAGGEDFVVRAEYDLLVGRGHQVRQFIVRNKDVDLESLLGKTRLSLGAIWSTRHNHELDKAIDDFKPDVAHVHNSFPQLSPAVFRHLKQRGCRVVATLHNYRFLCAGATFLRNGKACTDCLSGSQFNGIRHACYRGSHMGTAAIVASSALHRAIGTFQTSVDAFIVLSPFAADIFERAGLPRDRMCLKQNFVAPPKSDLLKRSRKNQLLFAGRISREKGLARLLEAWAKTNHKGWKLVVAGDGPDRSTLQSAHEKTANIEWLGNVQYERIRELCSDSKWIVIPSNCYEQTPLIGLDALSVGTPVLVPRLGPMPDLVEPEGAGLVFADDDPADFITKLGQAIAVSDPCWAKLSRAALAKWEAAYSPDIAYDLLQSAYKMAGA